MDNICFVVFLNFILKKRPHCHKSQCQVCVNQFGLSNTCAQRPTKNNTRITMTKANGNGGDRTNKSDQIIYRLTYIFFSSLPRGLDELGHKKGSAKY